jgi:hypothetical protein
MHLLCQRRFSTKPTLDRGRTTKFVACDGFPTIGLVVQQPERLLVSTEGFYAAREMKNKIWLRLAVVSAT